LNPRDPGFEQAHELLAKAEVNADQKRAIQAILHRGLAEQTKQATEHVVGNLAGSISDRIGARAEERRQVGRRAAEEI
jgi:hypothetical protein